MRDYSKLTIAHAQATQPWTVPYSPEVQAVAGAEMPHILGTHAVLHAQKTLGQIAAVFEALDHSGGTASISQITTLSDKSADLVTAALRLANLFGFDLATALVERSEDKNNVTLSW